MVPGIMGSSLADANGRPIWSLGPRGLLHALRTLGRSLKDLQLPADQGDDAAPDGVIPTGLIGGLHVIPGLWSPVEGYAGLVRFLRGPRFGLVEDRPEVREAHPGNLILFAYDWRLSNRRNAEILKQRVDQALDRWRASAPERSDAMVIFVCHSMGGLVARWYVECDGGAATTRSLMTIGTPHRGALNALDQLANGVRKGVGPLTVDLTAFARSLPSSYQLLPEYACVEGDSAGLLKTTEIEIPGLDPGLVSDGLAFHDSLDTLTAPSYPLVPVVGINQPTATTARIVADRLEPLWTIEEEERGGDGTVPRHAARPKRMNERDSSLQGVGEGHGALAGHRSVLDQLDFVLTAEERVYRAAEPSQDERKLGAAVADLHVAGEPVSVEVRSPERRVVEVSAYDEQATRVDRGLVTFSGELDNMDRHVGRAVLDRLAPGGYRIKVRAPDDPGGLEATPVHGATLVWAA